MSDQRRNWASLPSADAEQRSYFGLLRAATVLVTMIGFSPTASALSAGCNQLNGFVTFVGGLSQGGSIIGTGFSKGEIITATATASGGDTAVVSLANVTTGQILAPSGGGFTYVVPADTSDELGLNNSLNGVTTSVTWNCVAGPSTSSSGSQLLEQTRQVFSKLAAQTSSQAMGDATSGAISDAFSGGGTTQLANGQIRTSFAAIENAKMAAEKSSSTAGDANDAFASLSYAKAPYAKAQLFVRSPWHVWIDGRFTSYEDRSFASFDGWQNNGAGGASYMFNDRFLAGIILGVENFKYGLTSAGLPASLRGDGVSGGGYFGWKFYDHMRLDGMLTYGRVNYDAAAGPVTGSFGADRITGMSKLSGRYGLGAFYLEPSAMLTIASERQDSFTDTAAVLHDKFSFVVGRASTGGTVGVPIACGTSVVTPTFGIFGDYRFGDETAAALSSVPTFNNGWSAHINGGLSIAMPGNITASASSEYGGLGQDLTYWRAKGSLGMKF